MKHNSKPDWIRAKLPTKKQFGQIKRILGYTGLYTICEEALCPNRTECWEAGTATFLLMGNICTRRCKFCDVRTGNPHQYLDPNEPENLAKTIHDLRLRYVVLTSVDRDDLSDGGATHLKCCIEAVRKIDPNILIEILIPDFKGDSDALKIILDAKPDVIGHNIETTETLTPMVRDKRASFKQSIEVLYNIKKIEPRILTKSSIMLGLGETDQQVLSTLRDLNRVKVDIITLGQYLQPSRKQLPVLEYINPQKFEYWKKVALEIGFFYVVSGPLVRSSYRAGELFVKEYLNNANLQRNTINNNN